MAIGHTRGGAGGGAGHGAAGGTTVSSWLTVNAGGRSGEGRGLLLALDAEAKPDQHSPSPTASREPRGGAISPKAKGF